MALFRPRQIRISTFSG